jgi:hypothetical protein
MLPHRFPWLLYELLALVLLLFVPLNLGCVKLRTLECESSHEGCRDPQPDARPADSQVRYQDAAMNESGDLGSTDSGVRPGTSDAPCDDSNLADAGNVTVADGALSDLASDPPEGFKDAALFDLRASDGGRAQDACLPNSMDMMLADWRPRETAPADTMPADAMPADTTGSPEVLPVDCRPSTDAGSADVGLDAVPNYTVTFSAGRAVGAMSGNGWVTMGVKDNVTSPTCGSSASPITPSAYCPASSINWDAPSALCVSGVVPALSSSPTPLEYDENWGLKVGANSHEPQGPLGLTFRTIAFNLTGTPRTDLRAAVHINGDSSDTIYCALVTSLEPIPLTSFSTSCWDGKGTFLTTDSAPKIDHIGIQVSSGSQEIAVTRLCLTSIVFGS